MFTTVSLTGASAIVTILEAVAKYFGLNFPEGSILAGVNGLLQFVALVGLVWGQLRRKDLIGGIIRK